MKKAIASQRAIEEQSERDDLPEGWACVPLGEVATLQRGFDLPEHQRKPGLVPVWAANGPVGMHNVARVQGPGVVTGRSGTIGKVHFVQENFWPLNTALYVKDFHGNDPKCVALILRNFRLEQYHAGTGVPTLNRNVVHEIPVALPPLPEQHRIATTVESLDSRVKLALDGLTKVPKILKAFRQSVLAAACSGRLTEGWRSDSTEVKDGDLPTGWQRIPLSDLVPKGGIFDGPFGSNLKTADYTDSGVRVIRIENIGWLSFVSSKQTFISEEKYASLVKHTVGSGDIIFASFIEDAIRTCVLPSLPTKAIAKADCFCIRPKASVVDRSFLALQLTSRESYDFLHGEIHGATRPRVNTTQLKQLPIRTCSLPEQREIVRRVGALFKLADKIEERVAAATKRADKLTQAVLAKAFRGELVPTEAELARREGRDYESASALLARLKSEQNNGTASANGVRRPRASGKK